MLHHPGVAAAANLHAPLAPPPMLPLLVLPHPSADGSMVVYAPIAVWGCSSLPMTKLEYEKRVDAPRMAETGPVERENANENPAALKRAATPETGPDERDNAKENPERASTPETPSVFVPTQYCCDSDDDDIPPLEPVGDTSVSNVDDLPLSEPDVDATPVAAAKSVQPAVVEPPSDPKVLVSARVLCKFFLEGSCVRGAGCPFDHPAAAEQVPTQAPSLRGPVCKYFLTVEGCRLASDCGLVHVRSAAAGQGVPAEAACRDCKARRPRGKRG